MTKRHITIYSMFDVVLVPFPFIDSANFKRRPALILSSAPHFNNLSEASVMAMITSSTQTPWPLDFKINDLDSAGLPVLSIVRMKLFTLDHRLILKKLGKLSVSDQKKCSKHLKALFSLGL